MADFVIGDIQGCYDPLMRLLDKIQYDTTRDQLWLVGDLVNRGPKSLAVLRWASQFTPTPHVVLGNHDLYLLARLSLLERQWENSDDTIQEIVDAPDAEQLGKWLRSQPLLIHDSELDVVMTHAGIAPVWSLEEAKRHAREVEEVLQGDDFMELLESMYGNEPSLWSDDLKGIPRLRCMINYFTRMRFCDLSGRLCLNYKGTIQGAPAGMIPWFSHPTRKPIANTIVFGHWAALGILQPAERIYALDTGCVWGQALSALRLQDKMLFSVRVSP